MFLPTKREKEIALEIRVNFIKLRLKNLRELKSVNVKRDNRIRNKKNPKNKWKEYMSETSTSDLIKRFKEKLKVAEADLIKVKLNDN